MAVRKSTRPLRPSRKALELSFALGSTPSPVLIKRPRGLHRIHPRRRSVDEDWTCPKSTSKSKPPRVRGEDDGEVKKLERKEVSRDDEAAYEEFKAFVRGLGYGKAEDKERAMAIQALYSACIRKRWPVVLRLEGVRLNGGWVKSVEAKGERGAFWRERRHLEVRRRAREEIERSKAEQREQRERSEAEESEESDVDEDEPDVRKEREREKEKQARIQAKVQAEEAQKKKKLMIKGKEGKYLLVERPSMKEDVKLGPATGAKGPKDVQIGSATGAKIYIFPGKNIKPEEGKEWLRRMRDGEKFVPMERGMVTELLDGVNARKRKREDSRKQQEGAGIGEMWIE